jgi:hypothetical protein
MTQFESLAPDEQRGANEHFMSKTSSPDRNELKSEYDFASMKGGVRGKYAARLRREGSNIVRLEPDVAKAFPSDAAVNAALRAVLSARGRAKKRKLARATRG